MDDAGTAPPVGTGSPLADFEDRKRLAEQARQVIRGVRITKVGTDDRERAIALLAEATAILEGEVSDGPFWQTGLESVDQFQISTDPRVVFPFSPAMGQLNPLGSSVHVQVEADRSVTGEVTFTEPYSGPPWDTAHGGIIALLYDDLVGMAAMVAAGGGMTARLTVQYRKPTPLFVPIRFRAWLEEHEGRKFIARGEMHHDGELLSEADGLFIRPRHLFDGSIGTG